MKKPKVKIEIYNAPLSLNPEGCYWVAIWFGEQSLSASDSRFPTRKAARDWAKEWCRTVGAALLEKGK